MTCMARERTQAILDKGAEAHVVKREFKALLAAIPPTTLQPACYPWIPVPPAVRLIKLNMEIPPAVIDIEASGFGRGSYPIEVGFVLPDGTNYCSLICPAAHWTHWDPAAEQLHHITPQVLVKHGKSPDAVASALNSYLRGHVVYSDGWMHDYSWLGLLFDEAGISPAFKLENVRMIFNEDEVAHWHPTRDSVFAEMHQARHRASTDALAIQTTVMRIKCPATNSR